MMAAANAGVSGRTPPFSLNRLGNDCGRRLRDSGEQGRRIIRRHEANAGSNGSNGSR